MSTIKTDFEELKRMAKEFNDAMPTLDREGLENGMKAFSLACLGCEYPDTLVGHANRDAEAPALFRIVSRAYIARQSELDAASSLNRNTPAYAFGPQ